MSKIFNTFIDIIHTHANSSFSFKFIDFHFLFFTLVISEYDLECSWSIDDEISRSVLIAKGMSSNNNWFFPSWNESWNVADDDRLSEYSTIENVSDGTIWTFPHMLKAEFLDSGFIRSDCSAFNTNFTFFDSIGSINGNLIIGCISVFDTEIKVFNVKIEEWEDKLIFDSFPDNSGHLIAIKFCNRVFDFDFFKLHQELKRYLYLIN